MRPAELAASAPGGNKKGCGIYMILCHANGRGYVGQAGLIRHRLSIHKSALRGNKHFNAHLQAAWNKYGESEFGFYVLENCAAEAMNSREGFYASAIDDGMCFNLKECGDSYPRTEEHKKNLAAARRAWVTSPEHMEKLRAGAAAYHASGEHRAVYTPEVRTKMSDARKGKPVSDEARALLLTHAVIPKSEEHRRRISEAQKGKPRNPEAIAKMAATKRGKPNGRKGIPLSEAHKQALRDAKRRVREGKETT